MKQEYPATPSEAFEATEVDAFLSSITLWDACKQDIPPLDRHTPCVLALDAGESNDTFATGLISGYGAGLLAVRYAHAYVPIPKQVLDFNEIEIDVRELGQRYAIQELVYDPFLLGQFVARLQKPATLYRAADTEKKAPLIFPAFPAPCVPFHQGPDRLIADKGLHDRIITRTILQDGNEQLREHIKNANKKVDVEGRKLRIIKRVYALKIDLAVMLSMGVARAAVLLTRPPARLPVSHSMRTW
jgi:phage terminase large subunit-like protein